MLDILKSTLVWAQYILFSGFSRYKNLYICILFSKFICNIKEYWWSLTLSWPNEDQRIFSIAHEFLNLKLKPRTVLWYFYTKVKLFTLWHLVKTMRCLIITLRYLDYVTVYLFKLVFSLVSSLSFDVLTLVCFVPYKLASVLSLEVVVQESLLGVPLRLY